MADIQFTRSTWEYRVQHRRADWRPGTYAQRFFSREYDVEAFVWKLRGPGRPDLAPVTEIIVSRRPVGAWQPTPESRWRAR